MLTRVSWLRPAAIAFGSHAAYAQQGCENLVNLKLPYTLIASATSVPERAAPAPAAPGAPATPRLPSNSTSATDDPNR